jgi:hypothetical protein
MMMQKIMYYIVFILLLSSCGSKIGSVTKAKDSRLEKFYETYDGKIHNVNTLSKNQYFASYGHRYMVFDGKKVHKDSVRAFQSKKGYFINAHYAADPAVRIIKGKLNVFSYSVYVRDYKGYRHDYLIKKDNVDSIFQLRGSVLNGFITDCKTCKTLLKYAIDEYESLPKWRQKAANRYIGSEKKLVKLLVDVVNEYNSH